MAKKQAMLRAFMGFANKLLPSLSVAEKEVASLVRQLKALDKKNPNKLRPSCLYFKDLVSLSNNLQRGRKCFDDKDRSKVLMTRHHEAFKRMCAGRKTDYDQRLILARSRSFQDIAC